MAHFERLPVSVVVVVVGGCARPAAAVGRDLYQAAACVVDVVAFGRLDAGPGVELLKARSLHRCSLCLL